MAKRITNDHMYRLITRAHEVATEPGMSPVVKCVYDDVLAGDGTAYCNRHEAFKKAEGIARAAKQKVDRMLAVYDPVYREARSAAFAYYPAVTLPDTLKTQPTDTDRVNAVTDLSKFVHSHAGEKWAQAVLNGPFGTLSPKFVAELKESIAANKALVTAQGERAAAYQDAYDKYLRFKQVVQDSLGASSPQYRRLKVRAKPKPHEEDAEEAAPESGVVRAGNEAQPVKTDETPQRNAG